MKNNQINNLKDLELKAKEIIEKIDSLNKKTVIVLLNGDLGSGKTALVKKIGKVLKIKEEIVSPTFIISKIYKINKKTISNFKKLIHIDAYRLNKNDFININLNKQIKQKGNLIFIEWPNIFQDKIEEKHIIINIEYINENKRNLDIKWIN